jgi:tetratricopeptide (TPR) repeat protein
MEFSGANITGDVIQTSLEMVEEAVAYLLLIGHRYGQTPECPENPKGLSITELEFEKAQGRGLPILLFLMGDGHRVVRADVETDPEKIKKLEAFRERAKRATEAGTVERVYAVFEDLSDFSKKVAHAVAKLAVALPASAAEPTAPTAPTPTLSNISIRVPEHFLGRDDAMAAVAMALARDAGRVAITALHGLRGVGNTTLAAAFALRHAKDYRATWWIRAQTPETMRADLVGLGVRLGWVAEGVPEETAVATVLALLRDEGGGVLLIYDNAIDAASLRPFLPNGGGARVLVTSNAPDWRSVAQPIEIFLWEKETGRDYLIARTGRTEEVAAAEALSHALQGLPLAHEQAAAYCETLDVGFADYLARFEAEPLLHLDDADFAPQDHNDRQTVARSFALGIEQARAVDPLAEPLIRHAALLPAEPIPLFFLEELVVQSLLPPAGEGGPAPAGPDEGVGPSAAPSPDPASPGHPLPQSGRGKRPQLALEKAIAALRRFALVDLEEIADERDESQNTKCLRLHRLVRYVAAAGPSREAETAARRALIRAMAAVYPVGVFNDPNCWPRGRRLDALALDLVEEGEPPKGAEEGAIFLWDRLASYRQTALGAYRAALPMFEKALALAERHYPPDHVEIAIQLSDLGALLRELGGAENLEAARAHLSRALVIDEKARGTEHPAVAIRLSILALVLQALGGAHNLEAARAHLTRALAIDEKARGKEHPAVAVRLSNLAMVLHDLGGTENLEEARAHIMRALEIDEKALGPEHPKVAIRLSNLAGVLTDLRGADNLEAACAHLTRALAIDEKALGPDHPYVAIRLWWLATILPDIGGPENIRQARSHYRRAEAIFRAALGDEHPNTQNLLANFARFREKHGEA